MEGKNTCLGGFLLHFLLFNNTVLISLVAAGFWFCLCSNSENKWCFWASSGLSKQFWDVVIEMAQVCHLLTLPSPASLVFFIKMGSLENMELTSFVFCIWLIQFSNMNPKSQLYNFFYPFHPFLSWWWISSLLLRPALFFNTDFNGPVLSNNT